MQNQPKRPERRGLSSAYVNATFKLPQELRARLPLEDKAVDRLAQGRNLAIRGFWRIGKTELMRGAIGGACEKLRQNGIFFDLRSDQHENGVPKTEAEVLGKIAERLGELYAACRADIKIDPANPLRSLEHVQSPFFLGIDEMIALHAIGEEGMGRVIGMMKALPDNIRLVVVCHRSRAVDGIFDREFGSDARFDTIFVPMITDEEAEKLILTPATPLGYSFTPGAIGELARKSGNKPWELFTYAYMVADAMERLGVEEADGDLVEEVVSLRTAMNDDFGSLVIENYARIYLTAMDEGEKGVMRGIALGAFDEHAAGDAGLMSLLQSGWIKKDGIWEIQGTVFREFIRAVETGEFKVTIEKG